jgi:hypothetical protein
MIYVRSLKGQSQKTFCFRFLSPQPLKNISDIPIFQKFTEIFTSQGAPPVSMTLTVTLAFVDVVNNGNNIRLLTVHLEVNLKKKMYLYVNSTTQRCPNKIFQNFLIKIFHLPLVSMTPLIHIKLWVFKNIWNGPNWILRGLEETDSWKKPEVENVLVLSWQHLKSVIMYTKLFFFLLSFFVLLCKNWTN